MIKTSSAAYGIFKAGAKFDFCLAELPYYPEGAGEYIGVAKYFTFLSQPDLQFDRASCSPPGASSHRPTRPASGRPEDRLRPVPMAAIDPGLRACEEIGCIAVVRASGRALWAFSMREAFDGITKSYPS